MTPRPQLAYILFGTDEASPRNYYSSRIVTIALQTSQPPISINPFLTRSTLRLHTKQHCRRNSASAPASSRIACQSIPRPSWADLRSGSFRLDRNCTVSTRSHARKCSGRHPLMPPCLCLRGHDYPNRFSAPLFEEVCTQRICLYVV